MKYLTVGFISFAMISSVSFASGDHDHHHDAKEEIKVEKMNHDMHKDMDHSSHTMNDTDGHHAEGMGHGSSMVGKPGGEDNVTKVIKVEATYQMRFMHEAFEAKAGETIKFVVTNTGKIMHEFAVGTKAEHKAHGKMMMANPNMHHGASAGVISIEPGKTDSLIWEFSKPMSAQLACNVPGHYEAGMHSDINIKK
jgi:uncharacterized cupredoxin-like copper-binding protein